MVEKFLSPLKSAFIYTFIHPFTSVVRTELLLLLNAKGF